jgi:hypothetical protein
MGAPVVASSSARARSHCRTEGVDHPLFVRLPDTAARRGLRMSRTARAIASDWHDLLRANASRSRGSALGHTACAAVAIRWYRFRAPSSEDRSTAEYCTATDGTSSVVVAACAMLDPMPSTHPTSTAARRRIGSEDRFVGLIADIVALLKFVTGYVSIFICRDISRRGYETPKVRACEVITCRSYPCNRRVRTNAGTSALQRRVAGWSSSQLSLASPRLRPSRQRDRPRKLGDGASHCASPR